MRILVTAASRGIGYEIAWRLAVRGNMVYICSRSRDNLERAVRLAERRGAELLASTCDLTSKDSLEKLVRESSRTMGGVDALIFNSGNVSREPLYLEEAGYEDWLEAALLHLVAPGYLSSLLIRSMVKQGFGRLIYLSAISVKEPMSPLVLADSARSGILQLSRIIARKYASRGVTSNVILLGTFDTPGARRLAEKLASRSLVKPEEYWNRMLSLIPVGRPGSFDELADLLELILSPTHSYINGAVIALDGGMQRSAF